MAPSELHTKKRMTAVLRDREVVRCNGKKARVGTQGQRTICAAERWHHISQKSQKSKILSYVSKSCCTVKKHYIIKLVV